MHVAVVASEVDAKTSAKLQGNTGRGKGTTNRREGKLADCTGDREGDKSFTTMLALPTSPAGLQALPTGVAPSDFASAS